MESTMKTSRHQEHSPEMNDLFSRPKRPLSAYNLYFRDERERLLRILPTDQRLAAKKGKSKRDRKCHHKIDFSNLAKSIGGSWKQIDDGLRRQYEVIAKANRDRYEQEMAVWRAQRQALGLSVKRHTKKKSTEGTKSSKKSASSGMEKTFPATSRSLQLPKISKAAISQPVPVSLGHISTGHKEDFEPLPISHPLPWCSQGDPRLDDGLSRNPVDPTPFLEPVKAFDDEYISLRNSRPTFAPLCSPRPYQSQPFPEEQAFSPMPQVLPGGTNASFAGPSQHCAHPYDSFCQMPEPVVGLSPSFGDESQPGFPLSALRRLHEQEPNLAAAAAAGRPTDLGPTRTPQRCNPYQHASFPRFGHT